MNKIFLEKIKTYLNENDYNEFLKTLNENPTHGLTIFDKKINLDLLNFIIKKFDLKFVYKKNNYSYYKYDKIKLANKNIHPGSDILSHLGIYYIQEPSAASVLKNINFNENEFILDLCASPGGKSIQILYELNSFNNSYLISNEIDYNRARILSSNIEKMGFCNSIVTSNSSYELSNKFEEFFDKVLIDAPCSGEGMFRKSEIAVSQWSMNLVKTSSAIQKELLINGYKMLKPNGILIYSTCTYSKEEDEDNVYFLLNKFNNLKLLNMKKIYHFNGIGEGQFYAILKKEGENIISYKKENMKNYLNNNHIRIINDFFDSNTNIKLPIDKLYMINNDVYFTNNNLNKMLSDLKILRNGLLLGTIKNNIFYPSHAISRSFLNSYFNTKIELNDFDIQKYLHGETINLKIDTNSKYILIQYKTIPVGIAKFSNNQLKNLYPKGLRIH